MKAVNLMMQFSDDPCGICICECVRVSF